MNVVKSLKYLYLKIYPTRFIEFQIGCENLKNISTVVVLNIIGHRTSDIRLQDTNQVSPLHAFQCYRQFGLLVNRWHRYQRDFLFLRQ